MTAPTDAELRVKIAGRALFRAIDCLDIARHRLKEALDEFEDAIRAGSEPPAIPAPVAPSRWHEIGGCRATAHRTPGLDEYAYRGGVAIQKPAAREEAQELQRELDRRIGESRRNAAPVVVGIDYGAEISRAAAMGTPEDDGPPAFMPTT
jgi:hypothetical protein